MEFVETETVLYAYIYISIVSIIIGEIRWYIIWEQFMKTSTIDAYGSQFVVRTPDYIIMYIFYNINQYIRFSFLPFLRSVREEKLHIILYIISGYYVCT